MVEVTVPRRNSEVHEAMVQFAARRSYQLTKPWWIEGIRIEAPQLAARDGSQGRGSFWASLFDLPQAPRIEVHLKRRRGRARLKINVSNHPESIKLAYELHSYLLDDRSYDCQCPPICTKCGSPVRNVTARYCGRCGSAFLTADADVQVPPAPEWESSPVAQQFAVPPVVEQEPPVALEDEPSVAAVAVERDVAGSDEAPASEPDPGETPNRSESEDTDRAADEPAERKAEADAPEGAALAEAEEATVSESEQAVEEEGDGETDETDDNRIPSRRALAED